MKIFFIFLIVLIGCKNLQAQVLTAYSPDHLGLVDDHVYKDSVTLSFTINPDFVLEYSDIHFLNKFYFGDGKSNSFTKLVSFQSDTFKTVNILGPVFNFLEFENCVFDEDLNFSTDSSQTENYFTYLYLNNCMFKKGLNLSGTNLSSLLSISGQIGGKLDLSGITLKDPNAKIDISDLRPKPGKKIDIDLTGAPISNIILNYENFRLDPGSLDDPQTATSIYNGLLVNFKNRGFTKSYQIVDIEYRKYLNLHGNGAKKYFGIIKDKLQDWWWNYGYDKDRIIWITLLSVLVLSIINILVYQKLNENVYAVFKKDLEKKYNHFYYSMIYTAAIFFSFSLKLDKLKYEKWRQLIWFMIIYIYGLVCLAYLANYILKTGGTI